MTRQRVGSGRPWESLVGYSRVVRVGPFVHVAGTTGTDSEGKIVAPADAYRQAHKALQTIEEALKAVGASMADVVRTRTYVTDIANWEAIGRAHGEYFSVIRPAATMVEVRRLIAPEMLVEIEVDAIVGDAEAGDAP